MSTVAQSFPGIRQLYLFGSVLMPGRFSHETSDVDIGLLGSMGVEFFTLGAALDRHFDRTVDLVEIDRAAPLGQWILAHGSASMMLNSNSLRALAAELALARGALEDKTRVLIARHKAAETSTSEAEIIALAYEIHNSMDCVSRSSSASGAILLCQSLVPRPLS
ncbi:MAG TPA: nucleotidyltransferase domain-containing protein [Blastocatellia bacterium]|nr:nucleotidyltransferase domain-containing protein [Blastocatellia bacterium]